MRGPDHAALDCAPLLSRICWSAGGFQRRGKASSSAGGNLSGLTWAEAGCCRPATQR